MIAHRVCQTYTQIARSVDRPETERLAWFRRRRFCADLMVFRMPESETTTQKLRHKVSGSMSVCVQTLETLVMYRFG
ncbi:MULTISPECIES: hypothetical protein [unclassified Microcoleus]|uniref:hypothetical protein n=1 Tax=unclassified Microcoleus TaxID=2642155 RepID=UPI0025EE6DA3|nr:MULTISPECIES: hypothetical protein [unclassified Microcoleus]